MRKIIRCVGVLLLSYGLWKGYSMYAFVQSARPVSATVRSIEELKGPPKPRQKTPVHVDFIGKDGSQSSAITHLPMVYRVEIGDVIPILVDGSETAHVRLNLWSELWAASLTYTIGGALLLIVSVVLSQKRWRA
jgi:hypothetical protein